MSACGTLADELLRRVRDPQATAHPRTIVRNLLDRAQVLFIRATGTVIIERDITITQDRLVYDLDPQTTLRILDCFFVTRRLWPIRWGQQTGQGGPVWWRASSAGGPRVWSPLGTTHFIIYPAPTASVTLTLRVQLRPDTLSADDVEMQIPTEFFPRLLDFVEAMLLLRQRDPALPECMKRLGEEAEPEHAEVA